MPQMIELSEDVRALLSDVQAHAAACGRLDCGHLGRSTSRAVRHAVFLYQCEGAGLTLDLERVSADVAAVIGVLRESRHARPTYVQSGRRHEQATPGMTTVMPNPWSLRLTPQRLAVIADLLVGHSATEVSERQHRNIETVKSHMGWIRRDTGAHATTDALIALLSARRVSHRAVSVPDEVLIASPDESTEGE